jgi:hypothetical protein
MDMERLTAQPYSGVGEWDTSAMDWLVSKDTTVELFLAEVAIRQQRFHDRICVPSLTYEAVYNNGPKKSWHARMLARWNSNIYAHGIGDTPEAAQIDMLRDARNCNMFFQGV